jgi:hypothetical protein
MTTTNGPHAAAYRRRGRRARCPRARVRTTAAATFLALAVLPVAGCGAGRNAQTAHEVPAIQGVDADAGPIGLRDLMVPFKEGGYPAGSDVPLVVRMVSTDWQPVRLTRVTPGQAGYMTVSAPRIALRRPGRAGSAGGGASASVTVPPQGELQLVAGSGPYLVAEHITGALPAGASVAVTFTFSTGDSVDVAVPMAPPA